MKKCLLSVIIIIIGLQPCEKFILSLPTKHSNQYGYVTDTFGNKIPNVKITVLKAESFTISATETDFVFYTDENGFYELDFEWDKNQLTMTIYL